MRVANVIPDATIAVSVNGTSEWAGVAFEAVTGLQAVRRPTRATSACGIDGSQRATSSPASSTSPAIQNYTLVPYDTIAFPSMLMLPDVDPDTATRQPRCASCWSPRPDSPTSTSTSPRPTPIIDNIDPTISYLPLRQLRAATRRSPRAPIAADHRRRNQGRHLRFGPVHARSREPSPTRSSTPAAATSSSTSILLDTAGGTVIARQHAVEGEGVERLARNGQCRHVVRRGRRFAASRVCRGPRSTTRFSSASDARLRSRRRQRRGDHRSDDRSRSRPQRTPPSCCSVSRARRRQSSIPDNNLPPPTN